MRDHRLGLFTLLSVAAFASQQAFSQTTTLGRASVQAGQAQIVQSGPQSVTVNQSSAKSVIQWSSLSIPSGASLEFVQPSNSAISLNRVDGGQVTEILGSLSANGQVWVVNPAGVLIGSSGQINAHGFLATTHAISNADFLSGRYLFDRSGALGSVFNQGQITTNSGGYAVLAGSSVQNSGVVHAHLGRVVLASGETFGIDLTGNQLIRFEVTSELAQANNNGSALIDNQGVIRADGGQILLTVSAAQGLVDRVLNVSGELHADHAELVDGQIVISGGPTGEVNLNGHISAQGHDAGAKGGEITVTGDHIVLESLSDLNASGHSGGGRIRVGGDWQGSGDLQQAKELDQRAGSVIRANATQHGDGGVVVLWTNAHDSSNQTTVSGLIEALGAPNGRGGQIETSGGQLSIFGSVITGKNGFWLLDPTDITVDQTLANSLVTQLQSGGNAEVMTPDGSITVNAGVSISPTLVNDSTLTFKAATHIHVNDGVSILAAGGKKLHVVFWADTDSATVYANAPPHGEVWLRGTALSPINVNTNGGDFIVGGGADDGTGRPSGFAKLGSPTGGVDSGGVWVSNFNLNAGLGHVSLKGFSPSSSNAAVKRHGVVVENADIQSGSISIEGAGRGGGWAPSKGLLINGGKLIAQGDVTLTGWGAAASTSYGVELSNVTQLSSAAGSLTIYGSVLNGEVEPAIYVSNSTLGGVSQLGSIVLDSVSFAGVAGPSWNTSGLGGIEVHNSSFQSSADGLDAFVFSTPANASLELNTNTFSSASGGGIKLVGDATLVSLLDLQAALGQGNNLTFETVGDYNFSRMFDFSGVTPASPTTVRIQSASGAVAIRGRISLGGTTNFLGNAAGGHFQVFSQNGGIQTDSGNLQITTNAGIYVNARPSGNTAGLSTALGNIILDGGVVALGSGAISKSGNGNVEVYASGNGATTSLHGIPSDTAIALFSAFQDNTVDPGKNYLAVSTATGALNAEPIISHSGSTGAIVLNAPAGSIASGSFDANPKFNKTSGVTSAIYRVVDLPNGSDGVFTFLGAKDLEVKSAYSEGSGVNGEQAFLNLAANPSALVFLHYDASTTNPGGTWAGGTTSAYGDAVGFKNIWVINDLSPVKVYDGVVSGSTTTASSVSGWQPGLGDVSDLPNITFDGLHSTSQAGSTSFRLTSIKSSGTSIESFASLSNASIASGSGQITAKPITLSGLSVSDKVYDGGVAATVSSFGSLSGVVGGDTVSLDSSGASAVFADATIGTNKAVTVGPLSLTGVDAGNYQLSASIISLASISSPPAPPAADPAPVVSAPVVSPTPTPTPTLTDTTTETLRSSTALLQTLTTSNVVTTTSTSSTESAVVTGLTGTALPSGPELLVSSSTSTNTVVGAATAQSSSSSTGTPQTQPAALGPQGQAEALPNAEAPSTVASTPGLPEATVSISTAVESEADQLATSQPTEAIPTQPASEASETTTASQGSDAIAQLVREVAVVSLQQSVAAQSVVLASPTITPIQIPLSAQDLSDPILASVSRSRASLSQGPTLVSGQSPSVISVVAPADNALGNSAGLLQGLVNSQTPALTTVLPGLLLLENTPPSSVTEQDSRLSVSGNRARW